MRRGEKIILSLTGLACVVFVILIVLTIGEAADSTSSFLACMDGTDGDLWQCLNPENYP